MATLATNVSFQCFGLDGKPLAGGKVYTYSAGTTTSKATYTTMAGTVANPNPVILDQNGKAKIFLGDGSYRLQIKDSNDALIDDIDQISRYVTQSEFATFQQTVNDGVTQLTEVREQIDVFVNTSIGNQKGFANGIAPLGANVKVDPIYLPSATTLEIGAVKLNNTLASTATDQALTAAQGKVLNDRFTNDFLNTKTETGYQKYPNGRIEQWGIVTASGDKTVIFPIAFTSIVTHASITFYAGTPSNTTMNPMIYKNNLTLTGMKIFAGTIPAEHTMMWKVEGY